MAVAEVGACVHVTERRARYAPGAPRPSLALIHTHIHLLSTSHTHIQTRVHIIYRIDQNNFIL